MKKLLPVFSVFFIFLSITYPQQLHKTGIVAKKLSDLKLNLQSDKQSKVSASSFTESFESTAFPPSGWATNINDGGVGWTRQTVGTPLPGWSSRNITAPAGGGNAVAYCTWNTGTTYSNQWLITPLIQNVQPKDTLFFRMRNQFVRKDSIYLYYSSNDSLFSFTGRGIFYPNASDTNWTKWYLEIGQLFTTGSSVYIAFIESVTDRVNNGPISLDMVEVKGTQTTAAPIAATNNPTSITSTSATLNGTVNPNNFLTAVSFQFGLTTTYDKQVGADQSPLSAGANDVNVTASISGLQPNTLYHFRIQATGNGNTVNGSDATFTTSSSGSAPGVTANSVSNITANTAILSAVINPNNSNTTVIFEYGTSTAYGNQATATPNPISGTSDVNVTANLTGLQSNTTYHYRVKATNDIGMSNGSDASFATYISSITLNKTFTFTDLNQSSSRMIGLPGNNNLPINSVIDGIQKKDWNAFYDDGSEPINLTEFNGQALFSFTPGKGFWVLSKNSIIIPSTDVNSVNLTG
ncbi:MAG: hypothetical protein WCE54_20285, partial [Ignavibacteriaceae bacterium]